MEVKNYHEVFKAKAENGIDFEMFSKAGNKACANLVKKITKIICGNRKVTLTNIEELVEVGINKIAEKHGEVQDTEPPYHIMFYVNNCLKSEGYSFRIGL